MQTNSVETSNQVEEGAEGTLAFLDKYRHPEGQPSEKGTAARGIRQRSRTRTALPTLVTVMDRLMAKFGRGAEDEFFLDHDKHEIRTALTGNLDLEGTIKARNGMVLTGVIRSPGATFKSAGTIIIEAEADVEADIECEMLFVLGSHTGNATVKGTLINLGALKGDYAYGALESFGTVEGSLEQIGS
ncbi:MULTISPECIES: polymer-forming cytoskeletal protein [unclassified Paraburkholderia]|uniref:polymer-forming cytoskeletal protein n=1 Tax=unclassified Paraburkholderia TaxID=2615204 RepID=UPI002AB00AF2|nr:MULTISPECIES: polymer-forming cytoskeletal protein [unclassified Paraburkholderia]